MAINEDRFQPTHVSVLSPSIATSVYTPTVPARAVGATITAPVAFRYHGNTAASAASAGNGIPVAANGNIQTSVIKYAVGGDQTITITSQSGALGRVGVVFDLRD
jgi:hypothetical protein